MLNAHYSPGIKQTKSAVTSIDCENFSILITVYELFHITLFCSTQDKMNISCISSNAIQELMRGIRNQMNNLVTGKL
jgi:hypothetical protein